MLARILNLTLLPALTGLLLFSAALAAGADEAVVPPVAEGEATRVLDRTGAQRLLANKGLTLQWLDWNTRGTAYVRRDGDTLRLRGAQAEAGGPGRLFLDGTISEVGVGYFTFDGTIEITDTPDKGRSCKKTKTWHFAVTQNRNYYRLREFEWCDGLTDYIDIYF
ncbi:MULTISPECIES: hypothetical protein [unclassified Novosphingobium]|uniref:hypothetical protein n=1 Tax=unclassified Novosphingobium TaxID=2644732 RepID=UPI0013590163|nr:MULTISPECIES: hypothetical protein [unclassified Novosphingobium]